MIIFPISVDVVNDLACMKEPPDMLFHNVTVFINILDAERIRSIYPDNNVSVAT